MADTGWIKLYRSMKGWKWYRDIPTKTLFIHLLLEANREDQPWQDIIIKTGQCAVGRKQLAYDTGLTEQQVRTALKKLQNTGEITTESTNRFTIVTIVNYSQYQQSAVSNQPTAQPTDNQQITNKQPTDNQQITTNKKERSKEDKEVKNKRNIFIKPSLEEVTTYINENMFCVDPDAFYDYYEANGWMVGNRKMKDWKATIRNWDRREQKNKRPKNKELAF